MLNESLKRHISAFLDGELSKNKVEEIFGDKAAYDSCKEYLEIMRMIKRESAELAETTPEKLKSSIMNKAKSYIGKQKKAVGIRIFVISLIALFTAIIVWVFVTQFNFLDTIFGPGNNGSSSPLPPAVSSQAEDSSSEALSETVSSQPDISGDNVSSETVTPPNYDYFLPYGYEEHLNFEDRVPYKYVIIVSTNDASKIASDSMFGVLSDDENNPVFSTGSESADALEKIKSLGFVNASLIEDTKYDGISEDAELGVIFIVSY